MKGRYEVSETRICDTGDRTYHVARGSFSRVFPAKLGVA